MLSGINCASLAIYSVHNTSNYVGGKLIGVSCMGTLDASSLCSLNYARR
ncbi:hypothetical protein SAMN06265222_101253 [Neorhodopirellula lusitana]|uniref:Uncharacterized protein n=1 Tax=Neorhodopirellula lusitana TaxID=445327 RepID=A0ABY1PND5_9BACT|nr:hypothetical protein SAMN06265222_101253 [Neorhodopirellula lusitana]